MKWVVFVLLTLVAVVFEWKIMKHLWAGSRCENPIPAEEDVWFCYICVPRDCEAHFGQREPSFRL